MALNLRLALCLILFTTSLMPVHGQSPLHSLLEDVKSAFAKALSQFMASARGAFAGMTAQLRNKMLEATDVLGDHVDSLVDRVQLTIESGINLGMSKLEQSYREASVALERGVGELRDVAEDLKHESFQFLDGFVDTADGILSDSLDHLKDLQCSVEGAVDDVFAEVDKFKDVVLKVAESSLNGSAKVILRKVRDGSGFIIDTANKVGDDFFNAAGHLMDELSKMNVKFAGEFFPVGAAYFRMLRARMGGIFNALKAVKEPCSMCVMVGDTAADVVMDKLQRKLLRASKTAGICYLREGCRLVMGAAGPFVKAVLNRDICAELESIAGVLLKRILDLTDDAAYDAREAFPVRFICEELDYCERSLTTITV